MGKCKMGICSNDKKQCCSECDELKNCYCVCWFAPETHKMACDECEDYIESEDE